MCVLSMPKRKEFPVIPNSVPNFESLVSKTEEVKETLEGILPSVLYLRKDYYGEGISFEEGFTSAIATGNYAFPEYALPSYSSVMSGKVLSEWLEGYFPSVKLDMVFTNILYFIEKGVDYTLLLHSYFDLCALDFNIYARVYVWFRDTFLEEPHPSFPIHSKYKFVDGCTGLLPVYGYKFEEALSVSLYALSKDKPFEYKNELVNLAFGEGNFEKEYNPKLTSRYNALLLAGYLPKDFVGTPFFTNKLKPSKSISRLPDILAHALKCNYNKAFDLVGIYNPYQINAIAKVYKTHGIDLTLYVSPKLKVPVIKAYPAFLKKGVDIEKIIKDGFSSYQIREFARFVRKGLNVFGVYYDKSCSPFSLARIRGALLVGYEVVVSDEEDTEFDYYFLDNQGAVVDKIKKEY